MDYYADAMGADRPLMSESDFWVKLTEVAAAASHANASEKMKSVAFLLARADFKFNGEPFVTEDSN